MTTPDTILREAGAGAVLQLAPGAYRDLTFRNLHNVTFRGGPGVQASNWRFLDCTNVRILGVPFSQGVAPQDATDDGLSLVRCVGVTVLNCPFSGLFNGLTHDSSSHVAVLRCTFDGIQQDAIHGHDASDFLIKGNHFKNFYRQPLNDPAKGDEHDDATQWWGSNHRITIIGNVMEQAEGSVFQGVFFNDPGGARSSDVTVTDNVVVGGALNAFRFLRVDGGHVARNTAFALPASDHSKGHADLSGIREEDCTGISYEDNHVQMFSKDGDHRPVPGVTLIPMPADRGKALLSAFRA